MNAYNELRKRFHRLSQIYGAASILHWDAAVVMPEGSADTRAEQLATLHAIGHEALIDPALDDLLTEAETLSTNLEPWDQANLKRMRHGWLHAAAVPTELVERLTKAGSECEMVWRKARAENDFKTYAVYLHKVLEIVREIATAKAEKLQCSPYDALLDWYDMGRRSEQVDAIFGDLRQFIPSFLPQVLSAQQIKPIPNLKGHYPVEAQKQLGVQLIKAIGFDFQHGRLDVSHHPFCGGVPGDVRITTRYDETDFTGALMGVLHETGHALYESNLPKKWRSQPVGEADGITIHESQSLFMEMQICRSRQFLNFAAPLINQAFGTSYETDTLYRFYARVEPSLIRVNADEVTYPAHVILRYEIEKSLISGEMEVADLPEAWRQKMKELLGIIPPNDKDGCMQDIHWSDGTFGYFPTYTLGAIAAAQFFRTLTKDIPDILDYIEKGDFLPLITWLKEHIHGKASLFTADQLLLEVTGRSLNVATYKDHLKNRYLH